MSLSKKICKRCINQSISTWQSYDDERWKNGVVTCPDVNVAYWVLVKGKSPPTYCPYILEHLINEKEKL